MILCQGAQIVGINCHFDPLTSVEAVKMMKEGVEKAGLKAHYMVQPLAYHTPDCNCQGFIDLPEFPFGKYIVNISKHVLSDVVFTSAYVARKTKDPSLIVAAHV